LADLEEADTWQSDPGFVLESCVRIWYRAFPRLVTWKPSPSEAGRATRSIPRRLFIITPAFQELDLSSFSCKDNLMKKPRRVSRKILSGRTEIGNNGIRQALT
jgi:hypothetical protein